MVRDVVVVAQSWLRELPQQVHDLLEHVHVQVLAQVPPGMPADARAVFDGRQLAGNPDDDDDCDAGPWYDYNDAGDLVLVEHGGVLPPEGTILLLAPNLATPDDVQLALAHETGHALGMDEDEVAELGLA